MQYIDSNWTYDKLGRVTQQEVRKGAGSPAVVARQTLTYYGADDPKTLTHVLHTGTSRTFTYNYDLRHQLTSTTTSTSSYYGGTFAYGAAGRFSSANVSQTGSPPSGTEVKTRNVNYVYGDADPERVTALTNVSNGARYATFTYDAAGNMIWKCMGATFSPTCTGENFTYLYDGKDQLRRATKKTGNTVNGIEEYWYDKDGQRIAVLKKNGSGAATELVTFLKDTETHYKFPNNQLTLDHIFSHASIGTPVARVKRTSDSATSTELQFHGLANNTLAAVDLGGTVNASFRYGPFGEVLEAVGPPTHRRRFNDKQQDELTSLAYYGARYYDKVLLGWTQGDPMYRFAPEAAWKMPRRALLYTFDTQNPLRYIDPDGLSVVSEVATKVAGFAFEPVNTGPVGRALEAGTNYLVNRIPIIAVLNTIDYLSSDGPVDLNRRAPTPSATTGGGNTEKLYVTYTKENSVTGKVYSGRSSGPATMDPKQIVKNRDSGHHMSDEGFGPAQLDQASKSRAAIRGREQNLVDHHGGAQSTGGTSGNKINAISLLNPLRKLYLKAAQKEFGDMAAKKKDAK